MSLSRITRIAWFFSALNFFVFGLGGDFSSLTGQSTFGSASAQVKSENPEIRPDIQWFKEEMKISPKYLEKKEGILGMSWIHFLTMVVLVLFFFGALLAYHLRNVKTRQILERLLKEEEKNGVQS